MLSGFDHFRSSPDSFLPEVVDVRRSSALALTVAAVRMGCDSEVGGLCQVHLQECNQEMGAGEGQVAPLPRLDPGVWEDARGSLLIPGSTDQGWVAA